MHLCNDVGAECSRNACFLYSKLQALLQEPEFFLAFAARNAVRGLDTFDNVEYAVQACHEFAFAHAVRWTLHGLAVRERVHEADEHAVVLHHLIADFEELVAAARMDCRKCAVIVNDIKLLTATLGILWRKREQVEIERAQILVLAAQVVQFIDCGRGKIDGENVMSTQSPSLRIIAKPSTGDQYRTGCGA